MPTKGYTVLGWVVWQLGSRLAKGKITQNRIKLGAFATVALVVVAGVAAARAGSDS